MVKKNLHLGLGSFHRAHQAIYLHRLHQKGDREWSLAGGNTRPDNPELINSLLKSGGRYYLETVDPNGNSQYEEITSITEIIPYQEDGQGLISYASNPDTRIISFTVTEAGYYLNAEDVLQTDHPEVVADLNRAHQDKIGKTIYGALYALLKPRQELEQGAVTLLSCDNLRHNGYRFQKGFHQFIQLTGDEEFLNWVKGNTSSPNNMVDRITPRPAPAVVDRVKAATGKDDPNALMGEAFIQWVLEDNFINGRPAWEKVGAEMVGDVSPYEEAKIRLLNAAHSCIAWAGTLAGYSFIHEGTLDERIKKLSFDYVTDDVIPILKPSPVDLENYRDVVLDRFRNAAIQDTNQRVAMDGFSKIPGFIVPTIRERLARKQSISSVSVLPALFFLFLQEWDRGRIPYRYEDQAMDPQAAQKICRSENSLKAFCAEKSLWDELAGHPDIYSEMEKACAKVKQVLDLKF